MRDTEKVPGMAEVLQLRDEAEKLLLQLRDYL
jgi:hypothetical protein